MERWRKDLYLEHHGIKGMHWGIRRFQNADGSLTSEGKDRYRKNWSDDAKAVSELRKKKLNEMSNAELKKLNERRNLENQYKQLNPTTLQRAIKITATTAAALGTVALLHDNYNRVIKAGKKIVDSADTMMMREVAEAFKDFRLD